MLLTPGCSQVLKLGGFIDPVRLCTLYSPDLEGDHPSDSGRCRRPRRDRAPTSGPYVASPFYLRKDTGFGPPFLSVIMNVY